MGASTEEEVVVWETRFALAVIVAVASEFKAAMNEVAVEDGMGWCSACDFEDDCGSWMRMKGMPSRPPSPLMGARIFASCLKQA